MKLYNNSKNTLRYGKSLVLAPGGVIETTKENEADIKKLAAAFPKHIVALKDGEAPPSAATDALAKAETEVATLKKQVAEVSAKLAEATDAYAKAETEIKQLKAKR